MGKYSDMDFSHADWKWLESLPGSLGIIMGLLKSWARICLNRLEFLVGVCQKPICFGTLNRWHYLRHFLNQSQTILPAIWPFYMAQVQRFEMFWFCQSSLYFICTFPSRLADLWSLQCHGWVLGAQGEVFRTLGLLISKYCIELHHIYHPWLDKLCHKNIYID